MKKKLLIFSVLFIYLAFMLISCKKSLNETELCSKALPAVVEIQVKDYNDVIIGNATGTIISDSGLILTNKHVIRKYDFSSGSYIYFGNIYIRFYDETEYKSVELVSYSNDCDLALLQLNEKTPSFFKIGSSATLKYGEKIHTIGNGNGFGLAYSSGYVAAPLREVNYEGSYINAIQLSLTINEGNSGGPLINDIGELVGITTFRLRDNQNNIIYGTCFALITDDITVFLENNHLT